MSRKGNCWDNAVAESTFGTLKAELLEDGMIPTHRIELEQQRFQYIEYYFNRGRLHSAIGYKTPLEYEQVALAHPSHAA